jgi:hypothetical protein
MSMFRSVCVGLALFTSVGAAACATEEDVDSQGADVVADDGEFWGADRVGEKLANLKSTSECKGIPRNYAEVESCFGIGRKCTRKDSQEVFVVEESKTRDLNGVVDGQKNKIVPRAVVTGCNLGDKSDPASLANSYSLMVGLFSPPGDEDGDTLLLTDVEVMALDKKTGLFNFYVFGQDKVTRVFRDAKGNVLQRTLGKTGPASAAKPPAPSEGQRCFGCHVNGAPLMNEFSDPWTNWVSFKKELPATTGLKGTTEELVSLAKPGPNGTSSFANDLEQTLRAAHCRFVGGNDCKKGGIPGGEQNGFGHRILAGQEHGGIARLLKSAFCETELNYVSATASVAPEVFFEPQATAAAQLPNVSTEGDSRFPFLFPVRSEVDKDVELFLMGKMILAPSTVTAIRVIDDENDIFSKDRCGIWQELTKKPLPTVNHEIDVKIREAISAKLKGTGAYAFTKNQPGRTEYLKALLERKPRTEIEAAKETYLAEVQGRFAKLKEGWEGGGAAKKKIVDREAARKEAARKMFNGGGPLPAEVLE